MRLKRPIILSLALHSLIIACLWGVAYFGASIFSDSGGGGENSAVSVWIEGAPNDKGSRVLKSNVAATAREQIASATRKEAGEDNTADSSGGDEGGGIGSGKGGGIGAGTDGDPVLKNIWRRINSSKYYPKLARRQGLEGTPRVTFEIGGDGSIKFVDIAASSGTPLLDDAAMETIRRAAPLPYYPKPITLAVRYSLKD